jgi:hypothetical protein
LKIDPATCPTCGKPAHATADLVPGNALLDDNGDGTFEYSGETKMCWDGQYTDTDKDGLALVLCEEGHEWSATIEGDD